MVAVVRIVVLRIAGDVRQRGSCSRNAECLACEFFVVMSTQKRVKGRNLFKSCCRWLALTTLGEYRYPLCDRDRVNRRD